jgi:signal transduction histidine kinase
LSANTTAIIITIFSITLVVFGLISFFVVMMIRNQRKIVAAQKERIHQIQLFSDKLQTTREEEQKRIARELHDELGGSLTSIKYDLLWLEQHSSTEGEVAERFRATRGIIDSTTKIVQRICAELRPKILDVLGLGAAIEWQANEFKKRTGVDATFRQSSELPLMNDGIRTGIYRIVQECLTNIARHAQASSVTINMKVKDNSIFVEITDNGRGFDDSLINHPDSLGLLSLRERTRMINGTIEINGNPGKGTRVAISVPLQKTNQSEKESVPL